MTSEMAIILLEKTTQACEQSSKPSRGNLVRMETKAYTEIPQE